MKIDRATVAHIAALANLELGEAEMAAMERDLASILEYVAQLDQLELSGVEPMAQVAAPNAAPGDRARDDRPRVWFTAEEAVANAPQAGGGCFKVPRVIQPAS
ncbi:MAG TPA: Asp-tRNA(Asn)/Glu-tRNA(Gln) amidotransferase subunit GatC [Terriglobales bacterium]|jgi:aspartyl-tRNA(Asn)/glutamyl-tRNA(Gln) amidotransferase subunit C|nr:Asp-tRNA(Asn)/Glu-tRNA(Gln) amidotransferase subunit GatC [Terriglobales bacterium]